MRVLLIRHADHDAMGRMPCGRALDVHLNAAGHRQAEILGTALAEEQEPVLQCSPRRRAVETARLMAQGRGVEPEVFQALDEGYRLVTMNEKWS